MDYHKFPRRREAYDHERRLYQGNTDEDWWRKRAELELEEEAELNEYFTESFGQSLGCAAARFANLYILPPDVEETERQTLIEEVEAAMTDKTDLARHPILAAIEATQLRTDRNYVKPEHRSNIRLMSMSERYMIDDIEVDSATPTS